MELEFNLLKIHPKNDLASKFEKLHHSPFIQRIYTSVDLFDSQSKLIYSTEGIIDTGATVSIFPGEILDELNLKNLEYHTMWGIVNKKECQIIVDLAEVSIQLVDTTNKRSNFLKIVAGFTRDVKVPILLGMKSFLEKYSYSYDIDSNKFIISFHQIRYQMTKCNLYYFSYRMIY